MKNDSSIEPYLVFPVGTQIVTRVSVREEDGAELQPLGAVGVIVEILTGEAPSYKIRFPNGSETTLPRQDFSARKHSRRATLSQSQPWNYDQLFEHIIFRCIVGSRAFGLDHEDSDTDRRGIYQAPADVLWSLGGAPEQLERDETQETYWELKKFLMMALKANPNILECLYTPLVETATPLAQELIDMREIFLSRLIYQTYNGYVLSQFKKLEQDLRTTGEPRWKHAMHLIRLLISGIAVLREGFIVVRVDEYRDQLLAVRRAEMSWGEVNAWRLSLHREFDKAYTSTKLPEVPNFARAEAFLLKARRSVV